MAEKQHLVEKEHLVGVAVFMHAKSVDDAFEALQWARDFLILPDGFKLCILDIIKLQKGPDIPVIGEKVVGDGMAAFWTKIKERFSGNPEKNIDNFFDPSIEKFEKMGVEARSCKGKDIKQTLEVAINKLNLDMLILGWAEAGSTKPNSKCPVVHAKIDPKPETSTKP